MEAPIGWTDNERSWSIFSELSQDAAPGFMRLEGALPERNLVVETQIMGVGSHCGVPVSENTTAQSLKGCINFIRIHVSPCRP